MKVFIVRHTSVDVPRGTCYGHTDVPTAPTFQEEAEAVKQNLQQLGVTFDAAFTSPSSRAFKLAFYCGFPNARFDNRLKEMFFGAWEMQKFDEIQDPNLQQWYDDYLHVAATNGESFQDQLARVSEFLDEIRAQYPTDAKIIVFSHGGVQCCARIYAGQVSQEKAFTQLAPFGGIVQIDI